MKVSKDFDLREFIPEDVWKRLGEDGIWLIDEKIIKVAQKIRDIFRAPMFINTWMYRGDCKRLQWRGFRPSAYTKCAYFSQHKVGRAIDFNIEGISPQDIQDTLKPKLKTIGITAMEVGTPTWTHVDVRNLGEARATPILINYKVTRVTKGENNDNRN